MPTVSQDEGKKTEPSENTSHGGIERDRQKEIGVKNHVSQKILIRREPKVVKKKGHDSIAVIQNGPAGPGRLGSIRKKARRTSK